MLSTPSTISIFNNGSHNQISSLSLYNEITSISTTVSAQKSPNSPPQWCVSTPRLFSAKLTFSESQAQTPAQKRANARFAKAEEEKRGKPVTKKRDTEKLPMPKWVIGMSFDTRKQNV